MELAHSKIWPISKLGLTLHNPCKFINQYVDDRDPKT